MWLRYGVRSEERLIDVHLDGHPVAALGESESLDGLDVLPGFSCAVARSSAHKRARHRNRIPIRHSRAAATQSARKHSVSKSPAGPRHSRESGNYWSPHVPVDVK